MTLGFVAQRRLLASILKQPSGFRIRAASREDPPERELQRRTLDVECQIERLLEQAAGIAIATESFEQARRIEIPARARVEVDRLRGLAESLGDRRGLGVTPHPDQHLERRARAFFGRAERG